MKALQITLFFALFALLIPTTTVSASQEVSAKESREVILKKVAAEKGNMFSNAPNATKIFAKKAMKVAKFFGHGNKIDFQDPVDKFLWFAIAGWLAGALLYSLFWGVGLAVGLYFLAYLCWLGGSICFVIWILKKTGSM